MSARPRRIPAASSALVPGGEPLVVGGATTEAQKHSSAAPQKHSTTEAQKRAPFSTHLPATLARQFRARCALDGIPIQEAAEQAVRAWLQAREDESNAES